MRQLIMLTLILGVVGLGLISGGCGLLEDAGTEDSGGSAAVSSIFESALEAAAAVLSSDGAQQLAIAAAEACVASHVEDASQQALYNQIIASAIPALASAVSSLAVASPGVGETPGTAASKSVAGRLRTSPAFRTLVSECVTRFQRTVQQ